MTAPRVNVFGPFHYDAEQRLLFRDGEVVPLVPKVVDTLHVLLERRGHVVEKAELMKLVWPDTVVEDVGLARNISLLRKALDDESGKYIETIPRRGYRFAAEATVGRVPDLPSPEGRSGTCPTRAVRGHGAWLWLAVSLFVLGIGLIYWQFYTPSRFVPRGPSFASLAVVPFDCLSPELDHSAFSWGLDELLVADLSKLERVHVIAPSTVRRWQWVGISTGLMGRLLGLEVLVEGTVQKVGGLVRTTAQLVDVHTGKVIWAQTYEEPAADLGQAQTEVARSVAQEVGARLAGR